MSRALLIPLCVLGWNISAAVAADPPPAADATPTAAAEATLGPGEEYVCETEISYSWQRLPPTPVPGQTPIPQPPPTPGPPTKMFFTKIGTQGAVQADVRARLEATLASTKTQAIQHCRALHEDHANCIRRRLRENGQDYMLLDYASRRIILEAASTDCSNERGLCADADSAEIRCFVNRPPDVPLPKKEDAAAGGDKEKDKKKKKK